nr:MAG TPA_asm: hypothetical protein [Caudoviricetes sp.]
MRRRLMHRSGAVSAFFALCRPFRTPMRPG